MSGGEHPLLVDNGATTPVLSVSGYGHVVWVHADTGLHAAHDTTNRISPESPSDFTFLTGL